MPKISRRAAITAGLSVAAAAGLGGLATRVYAEEGVEAVPFIAYNPGAYFKAGLVGAVDAARTAQMRAFIAAHPEQDLPYPKINGLGSNPWGTPYALGKANQPIWKLQATGGTLPAVCADLRTTGFRAPAAFGDRLTGTSDSPFVVIDRGTGQSVWAAGASVVGTRTLGFTAAGRFKHASNGLDRRNPLSDGPQNERSRGAIPDAMVIRRDLMDSAIARNAGLGHVLHCFWVETDTADGFCHPMVGDENGKAGFGSEGERLAIAASVDLTTRGLSPAGLVIARTLQRHGMYLGDNAGSGGTALKAEQTTASWNPWAGLDINQDSLAGITWDDFVCIQRP